MTEFWQLPHSLVVEKPDATILALADLLDKVASGEWNWEFTGSDRATFRFTESSDYVLARLLV
jgi:hypothetical protein